MRTVGSRATVRDHINHRLARRRRWVRQQTDAHDRAEAAKRRCGVEKDCMASVVAEGIDRSAASIRRLERCGGGEPDVTGRSRHWPLWTGFANSARGDRV